MLPLVPLAERMRPQALEDYIGQAHLLGPKGVLHKMLALGHIPSLILWGPPGVGKTSLAFLLAKELKRPFAAISAVQAGVKEVREVIEQGRTKPGFILFIDEIHRFSKSQQDALLAAVEKGWITLIGATTENPSFEINSALLSRSQVYVLQDFSLEDAKRLIQSALERDEYLKTKSILIQDDFLYNMGGGDARKLLNLLEAVVMSTDENPILVHQEKIQEVMQQRTARFDKQGEMHYDILSAMIKSIRGSDPQAALYWCARLLAGGEDPLVIARRLLVSASEDVGNAAPTALVMATACFQSVQMLGMPESEIILGQVIVYLASSPKSNASYLGIKKARSFVAETGDLPVPMHLRNAPTSAMKAWGYGKNYQYTHDFEGHFVLQDYMPKGKEGILFYQPAKNAREKEFLQYLKAKWKNTYPYEEG